MTSPHPCPQADLWILAGQSNMEGMAPFAEPFVPHPRLWAFGLDLEWRPAVPPLHHLYCARIPAHRQRMERMGADPARLDELLRLGVDATPHMCGPGYFFGLHLLRHLPAARQIALLPCAHGGSRLDEWHPENRDPRDQSFCAAMLQQIHASGLRPTGMLWYQGESDALPGLAPTYARRFRDFVETLRRRFAAPDFKVFIVQLGRFTEWPDVAEIDLMRNAQARVADALPHVHCTSTIDCGLADRIHIDLAGQERLGERLARLALTEHYGLAGQGRQPRLERVLVELGHQQQTRLWKEPPQAYKITLKYANVTGGWHAHGRPAGFSLQLDQAPAMSPELFLIELNKPDPGSIVLWLPTWLAPGMRVNVAYGRGMNPYCNIFDGAGFPALAFTDLNLTLPADGSLELVNSVSGFEPA